MTDTVVCVKEGYVARLVLNNPARHNALGEDELLAVSGHLQRISRDRHLRALIVTSHGDETFCAGAALDQLQSGQISPDLFQNTTDQLAAMSIPTICAINGNAFGGGVEMALSCDFRIGLIGTRMRVPAAQIGLCYPITGIERFVEKLGLNLAKRLLVAAEEMDSDEMLRVGFLDYLVEKGNLELRTQELVTSITGLAPLAVKSMKFISQQAGSGNIDRAQASRLAKACANSRDLQEGFSAQQEKRKPKFLGK